MLLKNDKPALHDAFQALKALQSVTRAGVSYREYSTRTLDTKVQVDRYLAEREREDEAELRSAIAKAMEFYVFAAMVWSVDVTRGDYSPLARNPAVNDCPPVKEAVAKKLREPNRYRFDDATRAGIAIAAEGPSPLWTCAAERIVIAEKILAGEKK
jgi:hypothetical protein